MKETYIFKKKVTKYYVNSFCPAANRVPINTEPVPGCGSGTQNNCSWQWAWYTSVVGAGSKFSA
jgi:hypothetical protein